MKRSRGNSPSSAGHWASRVTSISHLTLAATERSDNLKAELKLNLAENQARVTSASRQHATILISPSSVLSQFFSPDAAAPNRDTQGRAKAARRAVPRQNREQARQTSHEQLLYDRKRQGGSKPSPLPGTCIRNGKGGSEHCGAHGNTPPAPSAALSGRIQIQFLITRMRKQKNNPVLSKKLGTVACSRAF